MFTDLFIQLEEYFVNNTYYSVFYLIAFIILAWLIGYAMCEKRYRSLLDDVLNVIETPGIKLEAKEDIVIKLLKEEK